jgi:hypothetical protein
MRRTVSCSWSPLLRPPTSRSLVGKAVASLVLGFLQSGCSSLHQRSQPRSSADRAGLPDSVKIGRPIGAVQLWFTAYSAANVWNQSRLFIQAQQAETNAYLDQRRTAVGGFPFPLSSQRLQNEFVVSEPCRCYRCHNAAEQDEVRNKLNIFLCPQILLLLKGVPLSRSQYLADTDYLRVQYLCSNHT